MRTHNLKDWLLLISLVVMWGSAFLFTKIAVTHLPPVIVVTSRIIIAAALLSALTYWSSRRLPIMGKIWVYLIAIALLGYCLPFMLISWGQQSIDSGLAGILMAANPLVTLVLAHLMVPDEQMTRRKLAGFVIGFLGVILLIGPESLQHLRGVEGTMLAQLAVLSGGICYSMASIIARLRPESSALASSTAVLLIASVIMLPVANQASVIDQLEPNLRSVLAIAFLGVFSTAVATVVYFKLVSSAGPTFLSLMNYLIPLWAVLVGVLFLSEQPEWRDLYALVIILSGIALSQYRGSQRAPIADKI